MTSRHWFGTIVILVIGYFLGIYFGSYGTKAVASVKGFVGQ